jgi:hypothetical protein
MRIRDCEDTVLFAGSCRLIGIGGMHFEDWTHGIRWKELTTTKHPAITFLSLISETYHRRSSHCTPLQTRPQSQALKELITLAKRSPTRDSSSSQVQYPPPFKASTPTIYAPRCRNQAVHLHACGLVIWGPERAARGPEIRKVALARRDLPAAP